MDWLARELRLAVRLLGRDKAFSLAAALTLAVCIGANTALFSVVHNVLLRPLPFPESDRIVLMANAYPKAGAGDPSNSGVPDYYDRMRETTVLRRAGALQSREPERRPGGDADPDRRAERDPLLLPALARARRPRPDLHRPRKARSATRRRWC